MRVVITGNLGYVGPCVVHQLRETFGDAELVGVDTGFFSGCLLDVMPLPERELNLQYFADVRSLPAGVFDGADAVVHLAALSNDPIGNKFEALTNEINFEASMEIARAARSAGVTHFVFASSCSVYGSAEDTPRSESSALNPLTAYARSKVATEEGLKALAGPDFVVTCLRFATACGMSPRLRLDLVLNDFVACAVTMEQIFVRSNGKPWRPLIHVRDMARAVEWAVTRAAENGGEYLIVNSGSDAWTFQIKELADAVAQQIRNVEVKINLDAPDDLRSYKVDFGLFRRLAPDHQPRELLADTITELGDYLAPALARREFGDIDRYSRLNILAELLKRGALKPDLMWTIQPYTPVPELTLD